MKYMIQYLQGYDRQQISERIESDKDLERAH